MPETTKAIRADRTNPNRTGAKRAGMEALLVEMPADLVPHRSLQKTRDLQHNRAPHAMCGNGGTMPDFNLLVTLDVLLSEGSVAKAARRLRLSPSAMSRALSRLREVTGDPLLVRAGRSLVATPRALELRSQVGAIVDGARSILRPAETLALATLA